ncbi:MAG: hypothetical protein LBU46_07965, partial [Candidatus Accumulibacter sp.]|nr:hypothetical protein [Accumulibacter sp.]
MRTEKQARASDPARFPRPLRLFLRRAALACALIAAIGPAAAQTPEAAAEATPQNPASALARDARVDLPDTLRGQLDTIGRYAEEVNRRAGAMPPSLVNPTVSGYSPADASPPASASLPAGRAPR